MGVGLRVAGIALGMLVVGVSSARAADVRTRITYGFDGVARTEYWSTVAVELANDGPEREGLLLLAPLDRSVARRCEKRACLVRLPRGSQQRYDLFWRDASRMGARPAAVFPGAAAREAAITPIDESQTMLVAVGFAPGALQFLANTRRIRLTQHSSRGGTPAGPAPPGVIVPVHVRPERLPESPLAYYQADLLALGPLFASDLSAATQAAITSWVRTGGNLVITGGADVARLQHPFFAGLLPVEGLSSSSVTLRSGLAAYGPAVSEPAAVAVGLPKPGTRVLAQEAGVPIIVRGRVGSGTVTFWAFDPSQPPLAAWGGQEKLWLDMFDDRARVYSLGDLIGASLWYGSGTVYGSQLSTSLRGALTGIKQVQTPPVIAVWGFLGLYFVLLIPVNYWTLGRLKRRELAWATTPLIVAVFCAGAYAFGYAVKGPRLLVKQATILEAGEGSSEALAMSHFGVFSPVRRSYDIHVRLPGAVVSETGADPFGRSQGPAADAGVFRDEREAWVENARIPMWGMRTFVANGVVELGGPIRAVVRCSPAGDLTGWIENASLQTLRGACVVVPVLPGPTGMVQLGDLPPGKKVHLDLAVRSAGSLYQVGVLLGHAEASLMAPAKTPTQVALVCRLARSPVIVEVGHARDYDSETYMLVRLPLQ